MRYRRIDFLISWVPVTRNNDAAFNYNLIERRKRRVCCFYSDDDSGARPMVNDQKQNVTFR